MKLFHMSFTTAKKAQEKAGGYENTPGLSFTDPYQLLAVHIIIRIYKDLKRTRDPFTREALLKWFETSWGVTICDFIGIDSVYIQEVMKIETTKKHRRNDSKRVEEVYPEGNEESEHSTEEHRQKKAWSFKGTRRGVGLFETLWDHRKKGQGKAGI